MRAGDADTPGATTAGYVPTPDVKGKTLTAQVTAQLDGYTPGAAAPSASHVATSSRVRGLLARGSLLKTWRWTAVNRSRAA